MGFVFHGVRHVIFLDAHGCIHKLTKGIEDGTPWDDHVIFSPAKPGEVASTPMGFVFRNTQHVIFRDDDGRIRQLTKGIDDGLPWEDLKNPGASHFGFFSPAKPGEVASTPMGFVFDGQRYVIFRDNRGWIRQLREPDVENAPWHDDPIYQPNPATGMPELASGTNPMGFVFRVSA
jgi:hypothetical protein